MRGAICIDNIIVSLIIVQWSDYNPPLTMISMIVKEIESSKCFVR